MRYNIAKTSYLLPWNILCCSFTKFLGKVICKLSYLKHAHSNRISVHRITTECLIAISKLSVRLVYLIAISDYML